MLVVEKSLMDLKTPSGATILTLLSNLLKPSNVLTTIFSNEEILFMCDVHASRNKI